MPTRMPKMKPEMKKVLAVLRTKYMKHRRELLPDAFRTEEEQMWVHDIVVLFVLINHAIEVRTLA